MTVICRIEAPAAGDVPTIKATIRSITGLTGGTAAGKRWIKLADGDPMSLTKTPLTFGAEMFR